MAGEYNGKGKFRANPNALSTNLLRVVDEKTPGTPQKDTGTATITSRTFFTAFEYTGKNAVARLIVLPTGIAKANVAAIRKALYDEISRDEVDCVIECSNDGTSFIVNHYGSGTLGKFRFDATDTTCTRGALP